MKDSQTKMAPYGRDSAIIPNGVNIPSPAETETSLINFGIEKGKYILSVGRLVPEKGFDDLIEAFTEGNLAHWKLVIVGDADHEDAYSRGLKSRTKGMKNVLLTGFLKGRSLHEVYSHAGLFVLPSYYEGLPIVLLEALSYELSCIASDVPANKNVELGEERFFKVGDVNLLRAKMKGFVNKPWGADERKKQVDMITEDYNWEKIADKTFEVYKRVVL